MTYRDDHSDVETGLIHKNSKSKWNSCGFDNVNIIYNNHYIHRS